jgi:transposase-like protein
MQALKQIRPRQWWSEQLAQILLNGKQALDAALLEIGRLVAEAVRSLEREQQAGPDYHPTTPGLRKWASQPGSISVVDQKVRVMPPRLRGPDGERPLQTYKRLKQRGGFSEELLAAVLRGMSARKDAETVTTASRAFGVSASAVSRQLVEATAQQRREFRERRLDDIQIFALFLDTIHRGGQACLVALGLDRNGRKRPLGFWEGATEHPEIGDAWLADLERRGLTRSKRVRSVTDGGPGIITGLKARDGQKLLHQRGPIHKDRHSQRPLPKRYRKEAHRRFRMALEQNTSDEARALLLEVEQWLCRINESAADSLLEAFEAWLTLHRLQGPAGLRKTLHSTNPIESLFATVRAGEGHSKRDRNSRMRQRWLAAVLLYAEQGFKRVHGHAAIAAVVATIEAIHAEAGGLAA